MRALLVGVFLCGAATAAPVPKEPPTTEEHLKASRKQLETLGIAILNFEASNNHFPTDIVGKDGKLLLSWRVAILPYIADGALASEVNVDEPWDSETNKKLIAKMPTVFAPIRVKPGVGLTYYQGFVGEKAFLDGKGRKTKPAAITDGTANTGLVFEAGEPVIWTKPQDVPFDESKPLPKLGGMFDGESHVLLCDGSVKALRKRPDEKELKKLITPAGGELLDWEKLSRD